MAENCLIGENMKLNLINASNPVFANSGGTIINLQVEFAEISGVLNFTASPVDSEEHGRDLYQRAIAGEFGTVQPYVAPSPIVPRVVTMRQARLALLQQGVLAQVQTAINSLPSPQKEAAQIEWDYSSEVHRDKPFVTILGASLGLTETQLDDLFVLASTL